MNGKHKIWRQDSSPYARGRERISYGMAFLTVQEKAKSQLVIPLQVHYKKSILR